MRYALVNPNWNFEGSIYFGCRHPHLPVEFGYACGLLEEKGHEAEIIDGHLACLSGTALKEKIAAFRPDFIVLTTAPTYLFWRCPPPELRIPIHTAACLRDIDALLIIVGPHASTTPGAVLRKTGADLVLPGEFETVLPELAERHPDCWKEISSVCYLDGNGLRKTGKAGETDITALPAIRWPTEMIIRHTHHHHRFDHSERKGAGAEMETSRGCPFSCSFCARENFRRTYRKRPLAVILKELDRLISQGVEYVYFIDEIFFPDRRLIEALKERRIKFGVQSRIELWSSEMLDQLGEAGCVSIEAGIESISVEGRMALDRSSSLSSSKLAERLIHAKRSIPFVQATLLDGGLDDPRALQEWRTYLQKFGIWANKPVPLFPYPGSKEYSKRWGVPDDMAWERALTFYLDSNSEFSDIQEQKPISLSELERRTGRHGLP
ncbi:MAG: TIGR04295 family B12-binding domain-containing radical SAM protein [Syntrophales bacterium]